MDKLTATLSSLESNISQVSSSLSEIKERLNRLETRPPSFGLETAAYPWANVRVDPQTLISQASVVLSRKTSSARSYLIYSR